MLNPSQLESMAKKIADIIPEGFGEMPSNMQAQLKSVLSSAFDKMDLVTREEFDVQTGVLTKTRANGMNLVTGGLTSDSVFPSGMNK